MSIASIWKSIKAAEAAREAAEAAKAKADMKILDEVVCYETSGLTDDQACHAVAHARNISPYEVYAAIKRVQKACKRDMEDRIMASNLDDFIEFLFSFPMAVIMFVGCLIFMALTSHIK